METNAAHLMDWDQWHRQYQVVPSLQARLRIVREQIVATLDDCPPGRIRIVSVCAGDGRDLIAALQDHSRRKEVAATLVDNHPESIARGKATAEQAGLGRQLRFLEADATLASNYAGTVPADLVILSGFLGHLRHHDAAHLIESLPMLCRTGGWAIWSRHLLIHEGREQVPAIRELLRRTAFTEVHFETTAPDGFAVGRARFTGPARPLAGARVLFEFAGLDRLSSVSSPLERQSLEHKPGLADGAESSGSVAGSSLHDVEQSIPARFEQIVAVHSSRKAIGSGEWRPTYAELNAAANRLARALLACGGVAGDRVALLLRQDAPLTAAMLAILKAGRAVVVLNPTEPPVRLKQVLNDAEPVAMVTDSANRRLAKEIAEPTHRVVRFEEHFTGPDHAPEITIAPHQMAYLIYTSGSTGRPKAVIQTHRNILHNVLRHSRGMELRVEDRIALLASPSGGQGLATTWCALLNGAALCPFPMAERGVAALGEWLLKHEITVYVSSVSVLRSFLRTLNKDDHFPAVRLVRFASEAASSNDFLACQRHFSDGCKVLNTFSSSETGNVAQYHLRSNSRVATGRLLIGRAAEGMEIVLWDQAGKEVSPGETGEIVVRSRYLSPGYWRDEALTVERFSGAAQASDLRVFRSGDLARRTAGGAFMFVGRKDNRVKVNGYRVDVSEIEEALARQPEVEAAVVCAREASNGDNRLVAYLVLHRGRKAGAEALRRALHAVLPAYMLPANFIFLDTFPLTPQGKVDRQALPAAARPRPSIGRAERPRDIVEKRMTWIWQSVLGVAPIGRYDDFFDLGGTSLQSVEVLLQIQEAFGAVLPSSTLAEYSTVEKLAPLLAEHVVIPSPNPLVVLGTATGGRPLFVIHSGQGDVTTYGLLARRLPGRPIYGLQSVGLQGESWPKMSVSAMARRYLQEVAHKDPTGPYLLGGTCMGGIVAFEMAQMLVRQGRKVGLLALLDVPHPAPSWRHHEWTERFYGTIRDPVRDAVRILRWSVIRAFGLGRSGRSLTAYRHFVANMNALAHRCYQPKFYPGTVTFFTTVDTRYPREDLRLLMRRYAQESRVITLPGNRSRLFVRPVVDELAKQLQACLEQADGQA
jgi:amino acid adenylation domain-containing protein